MLETNYLEYPASIQEAMGMQVDWQSKDPIPPTPEIEMVDLGLSSGKLWMKYNLGATGGDSAQSWYGNYYAWAETSARTVDYQQGTCTPPCNFDNYKYYDESEGTVTKYNKTDGLTTLQAGDDVITATYGANYRMPTKADFQELIAETTYSWVTDYSGITGLNGYLFEGNNEELFIPAAGYCVEGSLYDVGDVGRVWSSSLDEDYPEYAMRLYFDDGGIDVDDGSRYYGFSVRGVS